MEEESGEKIESEEKSDIEKAVLYALTEIKRYIFFIACCMSCVIPVITIVLFKQL